MDTDATARKQMELAGDVGRVRSYGAQHPDSYAGLRFDGPRLVALFTDADAHRDALAAQVDHPDDLDVRPAPYSHRDLVLVHSEVRAVIDAEPGSWISHGVGLTAVTVRLDSGFEWLAQQLRDRFGDRVQCSVGGPRPRRLPRQRPVNSSSS